MQYIRNQIWRHKEQGILYRILFVDKELETLVWINIDAKDFTGPETVDTNLFEDLIDKEDVVLVPDEAEECPYIEELKDDSLKRWEKNYQLIKDYINDYYLLVNKKKFSQVIRHQAKITGVSRHTIKRTFFLYWKRGMTKYAVIPKFFHSGGRGKNKSISDLKRGRKPTKTRGQINIDAKMEKAIVAGYKRFYIDRPETSLTEAYKTFIAIQYKKKGIAVEPKNIPTIWQFRYWGEKNYSKYERALARIGSKIVNKDMKVLTESSRLNINGPGSVFQIDSTSSDLELVSEIDNSVLTGSPILYLVTDVFSGVIVGFYITYEKPSYVVAMLAIANAIEDKQAFCAARNISYRAEEWPCHHLPASIVADKGELFGNQAENLASELGISIINLPSHHPELKGIVERHFKTVHNTLKTVYKNIGMKGQRHGERGVRNARKDACLTLSVYIRTIVREIIRFNSLRLNEEYPENKVMLSEGIKPIPNLMWKWGIENRSGSLRTLNNKTFLFRLLPRASAGLNKKGIRFNKKFYNPTEGPLDLIKKVKSIQFNQQFKTKSVTILYHPWDITKIYLPIEGKYITCTISQGKHPIESACSIWELEAAEKKKTKTKYEHEENSLDRETDIILDIKNDIEEEVKNSKSKSGNIKIQKIRQNQAVEKNRNRQETLKSYKEHPEKKEGKVININNNYSSPNKDEDGFPDMLDDLETFLNND